MSGLEVIGAVSAVITVIEASVKIYDSARKDLNLPEAFKVVGRRLPIILDTLRTCERHLKPIQASMPADVCTALEQILDNCDQKAQKLREIFEKVVPGNNDGWEKRYSKILKTPGKGKKVEELMIAITEDVQLVVNNHAVKSAGPEQLSALDEVVREMKSVPSSAPEEPSSGMTFHSDGGSQTNNINTGNGQQINNNAAVGTQNFGSVTVKQPTDFSFRRPAGVCISQAPYIDPKLFIGRVAELDQMETFLKPGKIDQQSRILVLAGQGGVGKTQLTIAYVNHHRRQYQSVFWLDAKSKTSIENSYRSIAEQLFDVQDVETLDSMQSVKYVRQWLSDVRNTRWLLVFDNYDDPDQYRIQDYYPLASHGAIIVTTRRPDRVSGDQIYVKAMDHATDSLEILATRSQRPEARTDPNAKRLVTRLGGLPLALATAGAYLSTSTMTFEYYLHAYNERWDIDPYRPFQLPEYQNTLYTTWDISYTRLKNEDPAAAELLNLLAYFDNQNLWFKLFHAGASDDLSELLKEVVGNEDRFMSATKTLTDYCFVEVNKSTAAWSLHNCVHDWTLAALNTNIDSQQYWYAFDCVFSLSDADHSPTLGHLSYAQVTAHALWLVQDRFWHSKLMDNLSPEQLNKCMGVMRLLHFQQHTSAAERGYERIVAGYEKVFGLEHRSTLDVICNLAGLYIIQGKFAEAEQIYQRAKAGYENVFGPEDESTLMMANNIGLLYYQQAKFIQAEQMLQQAQAGFEKVRGQEYPLTLEAADNLGITYVALGKLAEAEQIYKRVLATKEKELGLEHQSTLNTVGNIGNLYIAQDKATEAEQMLQQAHGGFEKVLGPEHPSTLRAVEDLGKVYVHQSKFTEAEQMLQQAQIGLVKALGPNHPLSLDAANNLGTCFLGQGKFAEAERLYEQVLAGRKEVYGLDHPHTMKAANNLEHLHQLKAQSEAEVSNPETSQGEIGAPIAMRNETGKKNWIKNLLRSKERKTH